MEMEKVYDKAIQQNVDKQVLCNVCLTINNTCRPQTSGP